MDILLAAAMFVAGLVLVIYFSEKLVAGAVGTSLGFGLSTFLISVVFLGFDPENLAVGVVSSFEGNAGFALGSVVGAAMVAIALAFGLTALLAPMEFEEVPRQILVIPVLSVLLLGALALDGRLSRLDGGLLLAGFVVAVGYLVWLSRRGFDIEPGGEVAETLEEAGEQSRWRSLGLLLLSLLAIIAGSELLVQGGQRIIATVNLSDTYFGMTILALLVSIEELARELPAALRGRPEISFGNVVGSILAFFLFNAGIITLVRPVTVSSQVLQFYLPAVLVTTVVVSGLMLNKRVPRWAGGVLVLLYAVFFVGGFFF
jgi:cation:H+ antiporter